MLRLLFFIISILAEHIDFIYPYYSITELREHYKKAGKELQKSFYECVFVDNSEIFYLRIIIYLDCGKNREGEGFKKFECYLPENNEEEEVYVNTYMPTDLVNLTTGEVVYDYEEIYPQTKINLIRTTYDTECSFYMNFEVKGYDLKIFLGRKNPGCNYYGNEKSTEKMIFMKKQFDTDNKLLEEMKSIKDQKELDNEKILEKFKEKYSDHFQIKYDYEFPVYLEVEKLKDENDGDKYVGGILKGNERISENLMDESLEVNYLEIKNRQDEYKTSEREAQSLKYYGLKPPVIFQNLKENEKKGNLDEIQIINNYLTRGAERYSEYKLFEKKFEEKKENGTLSDEESYYYLSIEELFNLYEESKNKENIEKTNSIDGFLNDWDNKNIRERFYAYKLKADKKKKENNIKHQLNEVYPPYNTTIQIGSYPVSNQQVTGETVKNNQVSNEDVNNFDEEEDESEEEGEYDDEEDDEKNTFLSIILWVLVPIILILLFFIMKDKIFGKKSRNGNDIEKKKQLQKIESQKSTETNYYF